MLLASTGTSFGNTSGGFHYPTNEVLTSTALYIYADGPANSAGLTDLKGNTITRVGTGSVVSNDQKKFGSGSIWCPGNISSYYSVTGRSLALGAGSTAHNLNDFTLEMWVRPWSQATSQTYPTFLSNYNSSWTTNSWGVCYDHDMASTPNTFSFFSYVWAQANAGAPMLQTNVSTPINTWHHVAVVRQNTTYYLVVNGNIVDTKTYATAIDVDMGTSRTYYIGRADLSSTAYQGYVDDIRLLRRAMYLNGEGVPTTALPYYKWA